MNKEDKYKIMVETYSKKCDKYIFVMTLEFVALLLVILLFDLSISVINDLRATANGYESDRNLCRSQLDSLTQELERWQSE